MLSERLRLACGCARSTTRVALKSYILVVSCCCLLQQPSSIDSEIECRAHACQERLVKYHQNWATLKLTKLEIPTAPSHYWDKVLYLEKAWEMDNTGSMNNLSGFFSVKVACSAWRKQCLFGWKSIWRTRAHSCFTAGKH